MGRIHFFSVKVRWADSIAQIPAGFPSLPSGVCGEPQRAGQLGGTYSLWSLTARMVGFPGGLGLARPEVSEAEGGSLVTQFCPELSWRMVVQGEQRAREDLGDPTVLAEV